MFAGVVHAKDDIRYEEIATPAPKKGEVLVKVMITGICGSDVPRVNGDACHYFPNILGHEFSGIISDVGEGVSKVKVGDKVAGIPLIPCMECEDCKSGNYALCKHYSFIGSRRFGSFAEYVVVPEQNVFPFDNSISFEKGALFEPSTVALHALKCVNFSSGKNVVVFGCGTIGLFLIQWCRILGASRIVAINRSRGRLPVAARLGATDTVSTLDDNYYEQAMAVTGGHGFDYVFEATGNVEAMKDEFRFAANKARICMVGTPQRDMTFSIQEWEMMNRKEFILTGSWMSYSSPFPGSEWTMTAECFKNGSLIYDEAMIDRKLPLSDIASAFQLFKKPGTVKGKILIDSEK